MVSPAFVSTELLAVQSVLASRWPGGQKENVKHLFCSLGFKLQENKFLFSIGQMGFLTFNIKMRIMLQTSDLLVFGKKTTNFFS